MQPQPQPSTNAEQAADRPTMPPETVRRRDETQPCPRCSYAMPALKGGSASICPNCGFKDTCCY
jgi:hypothetical protein